VVYITGLGSFDFSPLSPNQWHANEMIFGFIGAAILGFLLTASANWTGTRGIHGIYLAALIIVFLAARIVFWVTPASQIWVYQLVGVASPLWLAVHLAILFFKTKNNRNLILIAPLSVFIAGQIYILSSDYMLGYELALYAVRFLVVVIAGRVIPFFTKSVLKLEPRWNNSVLEKLNIFSVFVLIFEPFYRSTSWIGTQIWIGLTLIALFLNIYRLLNWRFIPSYRVKILFVLYFAYLWLPLHFALGLANHFEWLAGIGRPSLHSLAYGFMGIMILGIINRVTLGHTGRKIHANSLAISSYVVLSVGALARVFGPLAAPEHYILWIRASGVLWVLAFLAIGIELIPKLLSPRVDGKEY